MKELPVSATLLISSTAATIQRRAFPLRTMFVAGSLLAAGVVFQPWKLLGDKPAVAAPVAHDVAPNVKTAQPTLATTNNVQLPATVRPWQSTILYSRVTGYLTKWEVDLGSKVTAGQVLAQLETPELDQEVAAAQAQASEATAAAVQAKAELTEAESELNVTIAQLARVRAEVENSRTQLVRREKLLSSRSISMEEYETAQKDFEARTADIHAAEADVVRRRSNLKTRAAVIEAREATAKSRLASVERLKELQSFKRIVAPFDGVVTKRTAELGMLVTAGSEPLFTIQDMSRVRVQVQIPQSQAANTAVGNRVIVTIPEANRAATEATITRFASSIDSANRTMLAEIELENQNQTFQPGSYAQVTLTTTQDGRLWTIPSNTLQMRINGPHVAVIGQASRVEIKAVTLGRDLGGRVVVLAGIKGDEQLVVNPRDDLLHGAQVNVGNGPQVAQR
jgi:multidrug efflux pump subunit AcrA (membrane-fusion protein)